MAAALAEPPPGFKGDLADPPPGLKVEEEPKALAEPPPGLKLDEPKAIAPPPPGLKTEEPAPVPPKKPVTIDPGVDVGFGPGVAPPDLSPVTGRPISEKAPPTPSTPAPGVDIGFGPGVAPPPDWQKQNLIPGVGVAPTEPPKVIKPPVKAAAPAPAPKPVTIDPGVDVGFGPGVAPPETTPEKAAEQAAPGATEAVKAEVAAQQKADEKAAQLPAAVTAVTYRNDPNAQGEETQAPDETGALQQGKFVYSLKDRAESLVNQTSNKQDLYVRAAKIAADPNIPQAQKDQLLNTFAEAATKYATSDEPGALESGVRFAGGAIQTFLHSPELIESLARFGFSTAQAAMVLGKIGTGQEITAQDDAVLHTLLASASEGTASAVELGENIRNWLVKNATKGTNIKVTDPNMMSWDQINQLPPDQQKEVFLAKARWLGNRYSVAESRQKGELDPFWSEQFRNLTGHDPNTIASLAEQHIYPDTKAIPAGGMVLSPLNILFPAGEGLIGKSLLAERGAGMVTGLTADAMSKLSWIQKKAVEPWAPAAGKFAGGQGTRLAVGTLGLTHLPPPINWLTFGALGKAKQIGEAVGEKIGQSPQWMRENLWDPAQKVVAEQANDIRNGTNNVQANYGPLAPLFMRAAGGMTKGAVLAAPFAAGAETPEEAGSTIAFGAGLGGLHEAGAARDAALSSLFFRDPEKYKSLGYTAKQYGTDYFGQNYDMAHDAWTSGQSQMDQDRINDSRGLLPNVEQYHLGNQDYQDAVTHLQNNGYLPAGNLKSRGFNILKDPTTGKALILINGDAPGGFATSAHEIGHTIYRTLPQDTRDAFRNAAFQFNDPDALAQHYVGNLVGRNVRYMDLPSEAEIANGSKQYLPGLDGYTKEHFVEEMGAETVAALLRGQPLSHFIRDPSLFRRAQLGLGTVLNKMGIDVTPGEATTALGVRPGVAQMWIMDKALRDYFKKNPAAARPTPAAGGQGGKPVPPGGSGGRQGPIPKPKGRQTAATPTPTGGPAPVPPPPPSVGPKVGGQKGTNNQPDIGGGATGAPQSAIDDAVQGLVGLKFPKRQAQQMVASASGQTAAELLRNALKNHQAARGRVDVPRAPQESVQAQAPTPPHPLEAHRNLESPALLRRAIDGDPQATQALIERHGANWLQAVEKEAPKAAAEFRRKYPEQAAEQDQRIKAGVEAKPERAETDAERAYREKYGTKAAPKSGFEDLTPPHDAIAARAYELSQERGGAPGHEQDDWAQAEKELRKRAIDAAKARFKGRADFMPMAGERAQTFPDEEAAGRTFISPLHGKKQFEIDDRDMTMVPPPKGSTEKTMLEHNWGDYVNNPGGTSRLGDIINHPTLFKNYPDLRNLTVEMRPEIRGRGAYQPAGFEYAGSPETIMLQSVNRETLAHEIQHAVQYRENGWPRGDNPNRIAKEMRKDPAIEQDLTSLFNAHYPELGPTEFPTQKAYFDYMADRADQWDQWYHDKIVRMASGAYLMSPGEVEARAVGKRAVAPSGWRIKPEEQVALEEAQAKDRVQKEFERMQHPPMAAFMPDIPEEVRLRGAGAEKGKEQVRLRYDGAPPGVTDARGLRKLKDQLTQMANEGAAFRHWYTEGAEPMMRGVGNDPRRFEQLMANIAATSPQNRVYPNFGMAVRGLAQQEAGGRKITVGKGEQMKQRLSEIGQGNIWQGVKINQFYRDHMAVFDKRLADDMGSTMDMHMARAFGYPTDSFTPKQSQWSQGIMREITSDLGWGKPKETQAAIWSAIKARFETVWPEIYADAKASGDIITKVTKGGAEKSAFKDAATELKYRNRALKAAMQIPPPDLSEAAFNFGDALRRDLGAISYETRPSSVIQEKNPWMKQMTPEDWDEYHRQQANVLLDPDGTNKLAKLTNLISIGEHQGYSAWGTERNLSQQISAVMPKAAGVVLERAGQKWKVDPTIEKQVRDFAAAVGLLYQQDGVGYHRPYFDAGATHKESNGVRINAGRSFTSEETQAVVASLEKLLPSFEQDGAKGWFVAPEENGLRVVSWGHDDGKKIYNLVEKAVNDTLPESSTPTLERFASYGNLISNNWEENSNGEMYRRWLGARRRSDVQRLVDDTLRPQVQAIDDQWRIRKSGETEGGQRAASAEEIGQEEPPSAPKAGAMPDVPEVPRQRPQGPPLRLSPVVLSQPQEDERRIGIPSGIITPAPPGVRRGLMMPQPQRPAPPTSRQSSQDAQPQQQQPSEEGDQTGVADFFRKRGDQPITSSDDPRLTTVTVGGQSWRVNKEAAPAFQGFLNELAAAGAPIRSDGGWVYRQKVGASGISEHAYGGAIDLNQEGRNEVTPAFQAWISSHPGRLAEAERKWNIYGGERFGDLGHFEWGGVPTQQTAGADQDARRRTGSAAAAHIMHEEGASDVQDGIPEIFGFRKGQDSEYDEMARLRASGDEQGVQRMAAKGFVERAIAAGSQQFHDPAIKAQIMSLSHMRGAGGARDILNAVATGRIDNSGSVDQLDPEAIRVINSMDRAEFMRRIQIARTVYDKAVHGDEYWNRFGRGLASRYQRERDFYTSLQ